MARRITGTVVSGRDDRPVRLGGLRRGRWARLRSGPPLAVSIPSPARRRERRVLRAAPGAIRGSAGCTRVRSP